MRLSEEGKKARKMEQKRNQSKKQYEKKKQMKIEQAASRLMVTVDEERQGVLKEIIVEPYHSIAMALRPIMVETAPDHGNGVLETLERMQTGRRDIILID